MAVTKLFLIGNTTVPSSWVALVLAFALTYLVIRFRYGKRISGVLADSMFYFVIVWKLSVILTDFENVIKSPLSIIYFNGGQIGIYLGLLAGMITIGIELKKNGMHTLEKQALFLGFITIQSIFQLAMVLMNEGPKSAELVTILMFSPVAIFIWISIHKMENALIQLALLFTASHFFTTLFQPSSYINNSFFTTILVTIFIIIFLGQNESNKTEGRL
ncbi:hypothetical protein JSQ81_17965 [Sporosarcina sp. Marseille-Q4063]|uniref:hypothetical protein n=1 Tax=Sporosarcina sp. Marseille-Q4063 TaxID=2810514 RepID=UPI001BAE797E|nr:hypothetical protein [Sporosarcina sp. Marseille-Q4063]QUW21648.1 hypothetical protein JSQ81_17965 [Sporosarcina sp. Marseille-Q4063]